MILYACLDISLKLLNKNSKNGQIHLAGGIIKVNFVYA